MPYYPNGTWYPWSSYLPGLNSTPTQDPVTVLTQSAVAANPTLMPFFLGCIYVLLWIHFGSAPSRFKLVGIAALAFVMSVVLVSAGLLADAVLNFVALVMAYFMSLLFKR